MGAEIAKNPWQNLVLGDHLTMLQLSSRIDDNAPDRNSRRNVTLGDHRTTFQTDGPDTGCEEDDAGPACGPLS